MPARLVVAMATVTLLLLPSMPASASAGVEIGMVSYDSPGRDSDVKNLDSEYITVRNTGAEAVDLRGWTIATAAGDTYTFPIFVLDPYGTVTVHSGSGADKSRNLYWDHGGPVWSGRGDTAFLNDASGAGMDTCTFDGSARSAACSQVLDDQTITADIFLPAGDGPFPAVIVVTGGGWQHFIDGDSIGKRLASDGFAAFVVQYRLAPPGGSWHAPAAVKDVRFAVSWVRAFASDYAVDPSHVGALGLSAGGNLAMLAGVTGTIGDSRPDAVVSWSGPTKLRAMKGTPQVSNYIDCIPARCPQRWKSASPHAWIDSTSAPMFIANSEDETIPVAQATSMAERLIDFGVPNQLDILPGKRHAIEYEDDAWDPSIAFLHQYLG